MQEFTIFNNISVKEIDTLFVSEESCLKFISERKWADGYVCKKCGNLNYCKGKKPYSRRCTRCKTDESATANTIFHRCRINLPDAFRIAYLVCDAPDISTYEISRRIDIRQMTCWKFKKKIMECIESRKDFSKDQKVELKEIVLGDNG